MSTDQIITPMPEITGQLFSGGYPDTANWGLIFDRYLAIWKDARSFPVRQEELNNPLKEFVERFNALSGNDEKSNLLAMLNQRRKEYLQDTTHISFQYETTWHLVTGMGTDHPIGNGFVFDPLLGLPILPGSGIKGLCRKAAMLMSYDNSLLEELFGPEPEQGSEDDLKQGALIFHDAFPVNWPRLCVDIINCHNPNYYQKQLKLFGSEDVLVDVTESPLPVFFLALDRGARFNFFVEIKDDKEGIGDEIKEILDFALTKMGFGAKTAVGYGVMQKPTGKNDGQRESDMSSWLENTIQELMKQYHSNRIEILRGKKLAELWRNLPDGPEKEIAFEEIRRIWQEKGWWQNPRGKALKTAHAIYAENIPK